MIIGTIITSWKAPDVSDESYRPAVFDEYPNVAWDDVTGQTNIMPAPNTLVVGFRASDADYALIEADPNYTILTSEAI